MRKEILKYIGKTFKKKEETKIINDLYEKIKTWD